MSSNPQALCGSALIGQFRSLLAVWLMGQEEERWHRELGKITTSLDQLALDAEGDDSVVLNRLRRPTDIYLKKKKKKSQTVDDQEGPLITLIKTHSDKPVAVLSCAHGLTRLTVRSLLMSELSVASAHDPGILRYLGVIAALRYANPSAVSNMEARRARTLILLLERKPKNFLYNLRGFFSTEDPTALYDLFPLGFLDALLERLCVDFVARLEAFKEQCKWEAAYNAIGSLQSTYGVSQTLDILLNRTIRNWRAWTLWAPAHHRALDRNTLSLEHRNELLDIFMLDGPDFVYERHESLLNALLYQAASQGMNHIRHGQFSVSLGNELGIDSRTFLNRILDFPCGRRLTTPGAIDVFIFLCIRNTVDYNTLQILKGAASFREPQVYRWLSDIFFSSTRSVRTPAVRKLLKLTHDNGNHALLDYLSNFIMDAVQEDFTSMQRELVDLMENQGQRNPEPTGSRLQSLGQNLKGSPALLSTLDQQIQLSLHEWPSAEEVEALFQLHTEFLHAKIGGTIETLIVRYCLVRLTGGKALDPPAQHAIDALLWHWQERLDVRRRALAMAIMSCTTLPIDVQTQCLLHIRDMDHDYLREFSTILSSGGEMACTRLARQICSPRFLQHHKPECWKSVLTWMIEQHRSTLLDYTVSHLDVKAWFEWLGHLRAIFDIHDISFTRGRPILQSQLHSWSQSLEERYLEVLSHLQTQLEMQTLVQSSLREWKYKSLIIKVLDCFLEDCHNDRQRLLLQEVARVNRENGGFDGRVWAKLSASASTRT